MSDELQNETELTTSIDTGEIEQDDYEEITSEEVDRVVAALETLIDTVASENVRSYLEDAMNGVYYLIYDDEEEAEELSEAA